MPDSTGRRLEGRDPGQEPGPAEEEDLGEEGEEGVGGGRLMSRFHQAYRWHLRLEITDRQRERERERSIKTRSHM